MARWFSDRAKEAMRLRDMEADGHCYCVYCLCQLRHGVQTNVPGAASIEHVTPRAAGGALRDPANLVMACCKCNSDRQDTPLAQWVAGYPGALERIAERLSRNVRWAECVAEAKARGFKA